MNARLEYENNAIRVHEIIQDKSPESLQVGDKIIALDGQRIHSIEAVEFILDQHAVGSPITLTIERDGRLLTHTTVLRRENSTSFIIVLTISALVFFSLGILVWLKRSTDLVALLFHWATVCIATHISCSWGSLVADPFGINYIVRGLFFLTSCFTPVLFFHTSFVFPRKKFMPAFVYAALYSGSVVASVVFLSLFFNALSHTDAARYEHFISIYNDGRWIYALLFLVGVASYVHSFITAGNEADRRKLRLVMLGLVIGPLVFVLLWQIPQIVLSRGLIPEEYMLLISTLTPLLFTISIVRYQILDIDLILNRSTVYLLVLLGLMSVYTIIVGLVAFAVGTFTIKVSVIASAFAAVVIGVLFQPFRLWVQNFIDKRFFRVRYNYRMALRDFTRAIDTHVDVESLLHDLLTKIENLLHPRRSAFLLKSELTDEWTVISHTNWDQFLTLFIERFCKISRHSGGAVISNSIYLERGVSFYNGDEELFIKGAVALLFPIRQEDSSAIGFLVLGSKRAGSLYTLEDIDLLRIVVSQITYAVEHIRLQLRLIKQSAEASRLAELNQLKSYFVSNVSHELQTPLTSIRIIAEFLQTQKRMTQKERNTFLGVVEGESHRLSRLIDNVLDVSRIEQGLKRYHFATHSLNDIIRDALASMDYQLKLNHFKVKVELPDEPIIMTIDRDALSQVLINLVSNAIKYSAREKFLKISTESKNNHVHIRVSDKGIGIHEDELLKIFETFYRSTDEKIKSISGTGLGLTQIRHAVEAHGGDITVESKPGSGTTFFITLPMSGP